MIRPAVLLVASLGFVTSAQIADKQKPGPAELERKLHGEWKGGVCLGDWTFKADGTFELKHYTPGNHKLTGTWELRWNALPPTLATTCKASDHSDYVGKTWELKITQLDDKGLAYRHPDGSTNTLEREKK
jgi:hypothetical protein